MSSDSPKWQDIAEKLRRAMGLCPPTPAEADRAISNADEAPMSESEISHIVRNVTKDKTQKHSFHPDHSWTAEIDTTTVAQDSMAVLSRNLGKEDEEVDRRVEELRRKALEDDEEPHEQA